MTESWEEGLGTGPGGLVIPGDLDEQEDRRRGDQPDYWGAIDRHADRVVGMLQNILGEHERKLGGIERLLEHLDRETATVDGLRDLSLRLTGIEGVQPDLARKFQVEEVLANQKREFDWLRECHAWLRGAITVGAPAPRPDLAPRSRAGLAMLCLLWALTVLAAFGAGAVAFGGLRVDVAWEQGRAHPAGAGPTSLNGDLLDERRRERAEAERAAGSMGSIRWPAVAPLTPEAVPPGEDVRDIVVPPERHIDFAEPGDGGRPGYGSAQGGTAGPAAPALPPRGGPSVVEPGAP